MSLTCPKCYSFLPSVGNQTLNEDDYAQCGICNHSWIPFPKPEIAPDITAAFERVKVARDGKIERYYKPKTKPECRTPYKDE